MSTQRSNRYNNRLIKKLSTENRIMGQYNKYLRDTNKIVNNRCKSSDNSYYYMLNEFNNLKNINSNFHEQCNRLNDCVDMLDQENQELGEMNQALITKNTQLTIENEELVQYNDTMTKMQSSHC